MQRTESSFAVIGRGPRCVGAAALLLLCAVVRLPCQQPVPDATPAKSPIHFTALPIGFSLDSCETPQRHVPETMAGGVAVFDYNNDGNLDIFFTNGANITSLKKDSPRYWNRLFRNNGDGTFSDVTEKAGLIGTGFDATRFITTTAMELLPMSPRKPALLASISSMDLCGRSARPGSTSITMGYWTSLL
jgi:hypothetical protein